MYIPKHILLSLVLVLTACGNPPQTTFIDPEVYQFLNQQDTCTIESTLVSERITYEDTGLKLFTVNGGCAQRGDLQDELGLIKYTTQGARTAVAMGTPSYNDEQLKYRVKDIDGQQLLYGIATTPLTMLTLHYADADIPALVDGSFFIAAVPDETNPLSYTLVQ